MTELTSDWGACDRFDRLVVGTLHSAAMRAIARGGRMGSQLELTEWGQFRSNASAMTLHGNSDAFDPSLTGFLLLAHPGLLDPNFRKSVILISAHDRGDGALGIVLNRPTGQCLSDLNRHCLGTALGDVPLFYGGPVNPGEMILVAWLPLDDGLFRLFFGISIEKASEILDEGRGAIVRGFLGYSGWSGGQIENELHENAWLICPLDTTALNDASDPDIWRRLVVGLRPEMAFLLNAPDDPSLN